MEANEDGKQKFQSTLPARGATYYQEKLDRALRISIHAPREGSDVKKMVVQFAKLDFNPRSPRGERRIVSSFYLHIFTISIHAPREGSDFV